MTFDLHPLSLSIFLLYPPATSAFSSALMQNIEIKIELRDLPLARTLLARLGAVKVERLTQTDTYYRLADGRLKKREMTGEGALKAGATEWIFYHRDNQARPRSSQFRLYSENEARAFFGPVEPPVWLVVKKIREVYMAGPGHAVRVHLDEVEGLGRFLEFEALVTPHLSEEAAHAAVDDLRRALAPVLGEPLAVSYSDMLGGG